MLTEIACALRLFTHLKISSADHIPQTQSNFPFVIWNNFIQIHTLLRKVLSGKLNSVCFWPFFAPNSLGHKSIPIFLFQYKTLWYNFIEINTLALKLLSRNKISFEDNMTIQIYVCHIKAAKVFKIYKAFIHFLMWIV